MNIIRSLRSLTSRGMIRTIILVSIVISLSSCRHKDLYMEEDMTSELQVVFDWRNATEANPSSMALYLFEEDGHSPMRFIFSDIHGGRIKAPFGLRHAICMNADNTDWARLRNTDNIENMEIYTSDVDDPAEATVRASSVPRPEGTENERMASTPGMLWGSRSNNISITPHSGMQTITLYPQELVCHYIVDVYDVENLEGVQSSNVDATLSGMAEAYSHGQQSSTDTPATMRIALSANSEEESLHGEFLTFGECPVTKVKHWLTLYMVLKDGSKWYHSFDVTDQVSNAPDPTHVHIIVRGIRLPDTPGNGNTELSTEVDEWQDVNINLSM